MSTWKRDGSPLYTAKRRHGEDDNAGEAGDRAARWAWSGGTPGAVVTPVAQLGDDPIDVRGIDDTEEDGFAPAAPATAA